VPDQVEAARGGLMTELDVVLLYLDLDAS